MIRFYIINEVIDIEDIGSFVISCNRTSDRDEAVDIFQSRRKMLLNTEGVRVLKDNLTDVHGIIKVMLEDGHVIELVIIETRIM